jgi:hypothetical protein
MWVEIDVILTDNSVDWKQLGIVKKYETGRRLVRIDCIDYLQEVTHDIQILGFNDKSCFYICGDYMELRDKLIHISDEYEKDF